MNKKEFLAASLPYGLKCMYIGTDGVRKSNLNFDSDDYSYPTQLIGIIEHCHYFKDVGNDMELIEEHKFKPIIRPLDSLTKECVQSDYNEGKPFVPILELAKMVNKKYAGLYDDKNGNTIVGYDETYGEEENEVVDTHIFNYDSDRLCFIDKNYYNNDGNIIEESDDYVVTDIYNSQIHLQLLKWHFWLNKPETEEVVYVIDEFNPYK